MIRPNMQAARLAYETLYDGTRIETAIRHAASSLELVPALHAIEQPHHTIAKAACISAEDQVTWWRLGVLVLLYPYARHRLEDGFNFGRHVRRYAPRAKRYFDVLVAQKVPDRAMFVRLLRTILIRTRRHHAPVDWTVLGEEILRWEPVTKVSWAQGWNRRDTGNDVREEDSPPSGFRYAVGVPAGELKVRKAGPSMA